MSDIKLHSYVRFNDLNGSTGRVTVVWRDGRVTVKWVYGRDVRGDVITSTSSRIDPSDLIVVSQERYEKIRDSSPPCWGVLEEDHG